MTKEFMTQVQRFYRRLNGSTMAYDLTPYTDILHDIKQCRISLKKHTDKQLKQLSKELSRRAVCGAEDLDSLLVEAYALVDEAIRRVLHLTPFDSQLIAGIVLHQKKLAEMPTGEGKTLSAVFPVYLNALLQKGVHVLTFNDYLAKRDAVWMRPVYQFLGLNVGVIQEGMASEKRRHAYAADITYLTAKEAGFDFLRDSVAFSRQEQVHRPFHFAIVDEADSILLDEARIPLVLATALDGSIPDTYRFANTAEKLECDIDIEFDEAGRSVYLTEAGLERVEALLQCDDLYAPAHVNLLTRLNCALHAEFLLQRDRDYIVCDGKIELVDQFTGRIADRRRWPDGLQAALEAKERVNIQTQGAVLNTITLQHFVQMYPGLCGMTATAQSSEEEFREFYGLDVVVIPPHLPCKRIDLPDVIFRTSAEKQHALLEEIMRVNRTKRPILVGTCSVEESERLAHLLQERDVSCHVLNAKNNEHEARIIAQAGKPGSVTISTNMAGRGTDIRLGGHDERERSQVTALGGLYVIGTAKHESPRIDKQLRGRAGRQGDPGSSRFFVSLEDELFVKYRFHELLPSGMLDEYTQGEIDNRVIRNEANRMQRIIEGQHLEIKKTLCKYSDILEKQRKILFMEREGVLNDRTASDFFQTKSPVSYQKELCRFKQEAMDQISQKVLLYCIDRFWSQYLAEIAEIREGIHLRSIGGRDPYIEYQKFAVTRFADMLQELEKESLRLFSELSTSTNEIDFEQHGIKAPTATWTYLINDNPFEHLFGTQLIGNTGLSLGVVWMWPFILISLLLKKLRKRLSL